MIRDIPLPVAALALPEHTLRFFDVRVGLRSDSSRLIEFYTSTYQRFLAQTVPTPADLEVVLLTSPGGRQRKPILSINGQVQILNPAFEDESYLFDVVLNAILSRVRSHFLIHAAAVSYQGQGLLLAADPGHGKTTLALSLLRRGFHFLSDELAPLSRTERRVEPFPRSLRLRPGTLQLAGYPEAPPGTPTWFGKLLLDIDALQPGGLGGPAEINHILILKDPANEPAGAQEAPDKELGVFVDRLDENLLRAARQIQGVRRAWRSNELGYPVLRLCADQRMVALAQVEAICREQGVLVLDTSKRALTRPDFSGHPYLAAIPPSQAVMGLLRQFQPGHKSALLGADELGSAAGLFMALANTIEAARCYQLTLGWLPEMVEIICNLAGVG
jgi:hypothetical protein